MTKKERVLKQIRDGDVDRIPLMGGWFHGVDNLAALAALSVNDYLADPVGGVIKANMALHVDCMPVAPIIPTRQDQVRTGHVLDASFENVEPENLKRDADAITETEDKLLASLNIAQIEHDYRVFLVKWMDVLGDIVLIPMFWESIPNFMIYGTYGYEAYLMAIALYPESVGKLYWKSAVEARARNEILARLIREFDLPPILFTGHDICINTGPMCSLAFLRQHYFPQERYALEPLVDADIRVVRHCDGNVMPLIDDCIRVGYSGFQGFQYECGVDPYIIAERRSTRGELLIFFAGLNVTRTLPFGTVKDVRDEIEYVLDFTDGGKGLFFFTSSSIGPEVPLRNVTCAYDYIASGQYARVRNHTGRRNWPWLMREKKEVTEKVDSLG